jgi:peptidoglycan-associated lipoprotein
MKREQKRMVWVTGMLLLTFAAGCHKKAPVAAAPPPPQPVVAETPKPSAPTISEFTAEPGHIERGQSALLRWQVKDATEIEIDNGVGSVTSAGKREVKVQDSTTYTLLAKGPGGTATAQTTLNVTLPPPAPPAPATTTVTPSISERLNKEVQDVFFDLDRSDLRNDAQAALTQDANALRTILTDFPNTTIVVEGHCDERGSAEYNLGLGDRRAAAAKDFLTKIGIPGDRLIKVSYGKERPQCTESTEACWQKNRRVHFTPGENQQPKATSQLNEPKSDRTAAQTSSKN